MLTKLINRFLRIFPIGLLFVYACSGSPTGPEEGPPDDTSPPVSNIVSDAVPLYTFRIVNEYPHDRAAFTQGLVFENGILYEGTGLRGQSTLRRVALVSGEVSQVRNLNAALFGEGVAVYQDKIIQLTWTSNRGFVYDKATFAQERDFDYPTEGWGLTHDGTRLIMTDGTANMYFLNPETFERLSQVEVRDENGPVVYLNELEYIQGRVFANVWQSDRIAVIDPEDGRVTNWIDLAGLLAPQDRSGADVLNGIAFDTETSRLFVTGKRWPNLFEIELVPAAQPFLGHNFSVVRGHESGRAD